MVFLKNKVQKGTVPVAVSIDKVCFFKSAAVTSEGPFAVYAYLDKESFVVLAKFETQAKADGAMGRLECEIAHSVRKVTANIEPCIFIEAEEWAQ